jgi:hypothetical protein
MAELQPPKHRVWQIHLSTAMVIMIVAGILLFLNLRPTRDKFNSRFAVYGWPSEVVAYDRSTGALYFMKGLPRRTRTDNDWEEWNRAHGTMI